MPVSSTLSVQLGATPAIGDFGSFLDVTTLSGGKYAIVAASRFDQPETHFFAADGTPQYTIAEGEIKNAAIAARGDTVPIVGEATSGYSVPVSRIAVKANGPNGTFSIKGSGQPARRS